MKFALLAAVIGVVLLLFPQQTESAPTFAEEPMTDTAKQAVSVEDRMEEILSRVQGAGRVEVMLVTKNDGLTEYQTDVEETNQGETREIRTQTVFSSIGEAGGALVKQKTAPEYMGAVVVSSGADRAEVRLQLTKAVCSLTGLGSDRVTILKMESNY